MTSIDFLTINQAQALSKHFKLNMCTGHKSDITLTKQAISSCPTVVAMSIDTKIDIKDLWFCFSPGIKFVCFLPQLSFTKHILSLPDAILNSISGNHLTMLDKAKLMAQISMADQNGLVQLNWSFLCVGQMVSVGRLFSVNLTTTQIQSCPNISNVLSAKIRRSEHFKNQYCKPEKFSVVYFDFSFDNLLVCFGHGTDFLSSSGYQLEFIIPSQLLSMQRGTNSALSVDSEPKAGNIAAQTHLVPQTNNPSKSNDVNKKYIKEQEAEPVIAANKVVESINVEEKDDLEETYEVEEKHDNKDVTDEEKDGVGSEEESGSDDEEEEAEAQIRAAHRHEAEEKGERVSREIIGRKGDGEETLIGQDKKLVFNIKNDKEEAKKDRKEDIASGQQHVGEKEQEKVEVEQEGVDKEDLMITKHTKELTVRRKVKIHSVVSPACASLEQLRSIITYYGIECSISRRVEPQSLVDIIRTCGSYVKHCETSPIKSDVLFCLCENNVVICIFQELSPHLYSLNISRYILAEYKTDLAPSLNFQEKLMVLLQKAIASNLNGTFSVPWFALTKSQMLAIVEDHCLALPSELDITDENLPLNLFELLVKSSRFKEKAERDDVTLLTLNFSGTIESPLELQASQSYIDFSNNISAFLSSYSRHVQHKTPSQKNLQGKMGEPIAGQLQKESNLSLSSVSTRKGSLLKNSSPLGSKILDSSTNAELATTPPYLNAQAVNDPPITESNTAVGAFLHTSLAELDSSTGRDFTSPILDFESGPDKSINTDNYFVEIDKDFNLKFITKPDPCLGMVDLVTKECTKCKVDCTSEILCCGICSLEVHFCCYPSEKRTKLGLNRPMSPETFKILSGLNNFYWLCNKCETPSPLCFNQILVKASDKVKSKVSSSIGELRSNMEELEQLIDDDNGCSRPSLDSSTSSLHSQYQENTDVPKVKSLQVTNHEIQNLEEHSHLSDIHVDDDVLSLISNSDINSMSLCKPSSPEVCLTASKMNKTQHARDTYKKVRTGLAQSANSINVEDYTITWSSKLDQNSFIQDDVCNFCMQTCEPESTVSCYICSIVTHFPCSKTNDSLIFSAFDHKTERDPTNHILKKQVKQKCIKWFCSSCKNISFQEAAKLIGNKVIQKATKNIRANLKEEFDKKQTASTKQDNPPIVHFPGFQKQLCSQLTESMSTQFTSIKEDIINAIKVQEKVVNPNSNVIDHANVMNHPNIQAGSPSYLDIANARVPPSHSQICTPVHSKQLPKKVNPSCSIIIKNVQSPKFRNSSNCKSQFNKHFEQMRIKAIFSTQAGNIIVELFDGNDVQRVLNEWKPNFFCTQDIPDDIISSDRRATNVVHMENSHRPTEVLVKRVHRHLTDEEIFTELNSPHNNFSVATVKRFIKRNGEVLNTVKVTFQGHGDYLRAIQLGIFIHEEHYVVETFVQQQRAHQCFKCKQFGHPAKWCTRKIRCEYCSHEGHAGKDCITRDEVHQYHCSNCKGQHSSTYYRCPVYLKHLRKPQLPHMSSNE